MLYMLFADGFEELEAVAPLDVLRRAGVQVQTVGIGGKTAIGSHGVEMVCDITLAQADISAAKGVILPGGPGHTKLETPAVLELLHSAAQRGGLLAAICAAPSILGRQGYLKGKRACCFPGYEQELHGAQVVYDPVAVDGNIITSRGAGTALLFGLAIAEYLASPEQAQAVAAQMQCP